MWCEFGFHVVWMFLTLHSFTDLCTGLSAGEPIVASICEVPAGKPRIRDQVRHHSESRGGRLVSSSTSDPAGSGEGFDSSKPSQQGSVEEAGLVDTGLAYSRAEEVWAQEGQEGAPILQALIESHPQASVLAACHFALQWDWGVFFIHPLMGIVLGSF